MIPLLLLAAAAQADPAGPPASVEQRHERCVARSGNDPIGAEADAKAWAAGGGGFLARQCLGIAYAAEKLWSSAAAEFEGAARDAGAAEDPRAAVFWAQAGNAWLAGGDAAKARVALDAAIADHRLAGAQRGEAFLDRARAQAAAGNLPAARADLDQALALVPDDPLAWLLSAGLARRGGDLPRADTDIKEALKRSPDDASVQLEAGNIAALRRDEPGAKRAWGEAARLAPASAAGRSATAALAQFDAN